MNNDPTTSASTGPANAEPAAGAAQPAAETLNPSLGAQSTFARDGEERTILRDSRLVEPDSLASLAIEVDNVVAENIAAENVEPFNSEAVTVEPTAIAVAEEAPSPPVVHSGRRRLVQALLVLMVCGGAVGSGAWWVLRDLGRQSAQRPTPVAKEIPPLPKFLAVLRPSPAAAPATQLEQLESRLGRLAATIAAAPPSLFGTPTEVAPAGFVALPGGREPPPDRALSGYQRWEMQFPLGATLETYARELDFFGIELGVLGGSELITYVNELSKPTPETHKGLAIEEQRLYMTWQRGPLREADQQLVSRARLDLEGKVVAQFWPFTLERDLAEREAAYARLNKTDPAKLRRTVFSIRPLEQGFEFYVVEQLAK